MIMLLKSEALDRAADIAEDRWHFGAGWWHGEEGSVVCAEGAVECALGVEHDEDAEDYLALVYPVLLVVRDYLNHHCPRGEGWRWGSVWGWNDDTSDRTLAEVVAVLRGAAEEQRLIEQAERRVEQRLIEQAEQVVEQVEPELLPV